MLTETIEALGLPLDAVIEPAPAGASGAAWRVRAADGTYALRLSGSREQTDGRLAAMAAARDAGLPAPELIRRAVTAGREAVLLSWLPGITMLDALVLSPRPVRDWARLAGVMQRRLHAIKAPDAVVSVHDDAQRPLGAGRDVPGLPQGEALLHLDWHPLNLLVDEAKHAITGIVDWDNARRGHPSLDLARTRDAHIRAGYRNPPDRGAHAARRLPGRLDRWLRPRRRAHGQPAMGRLRDARRPRAALHVDP